MLVLRSRRRRHGDGHGGGGRGVNSQGLKLPQLRLLRGGSTKSEKKEGRFFLMRNDDDNYDNPEMDREVSAAAATGPVSATKKSQTQDQSLPVSNDAVLVDLSSESTEKSDRQQPSSHRDLTLSYPPNAHLDPSYRRSASFPFAYSEADEYTMSSMRSSCETSSVVRGYWAASMAARTERRLEGYPPSIDYYDEGDVFGDHRRRTPSFSSVSRKAEIMTLDSASVAESNILPPIDGLLKRHYRNTINSVQSYLRRSMSMSLSSLHTTFTSSSEEEISSAGYTPRSRGTGFRPPIDSEFLNHLNIKSLRSEERQLEYYTHLYRQNPTMTMSTADYDDYSSSTPGPHHHHQASSIMMDDDASRRTSSVPSLTSTNDPFKTFDSNEILLDMGPSADQRVIFVRSPSSSSSLTERGPQVTFTTTANSTLQVVNSSSSGP
ncbi:hypothetical protein BGX29_004432, partial [Mortierella sp. GBA35]